MDLAETIRRLVAAAGSAGEIAVDVFKDLVPPELNTDELENLIDSLNAQGIWIVDD
jgi:hypothetical protein